MEQVACQKCGFTGEVEKGADKCPQCHKRGTMASYTNVAWALGPQEVAHA